MTYRMFDEIIENELYLGCEGAATHRKDLLDGVNIKSILNVQKDPVNGHPEDYKYYVVLVEDEETEDLGKHFDNTYKIIEKAEKPVFVHCFAGVSRSSSVVIAYMMKKHSMSLKEAYNYVKKRRPQIQPNPGFLKQLEVYEKKLEYGSNENGKNGGCCIL